METFGVKYIGSKREINKYILEKIKELKIKTALDVFTGTTRVAQAFKKVGIMTDTSDLSWASECYANCFIHSGDKSHLQKHIDYMNKLSGKNGWLTENYSGNLYNKNGRCFQEKNTKKADEARDYVKSLDIDQWEKDVLITSIIFALDKVDNTVGVQQAYLKDWCKRSYNDILFTLPESINGPIGKHFVGNCLDINYGKYDLAYLDPPYSSHSYATYYHIWDSVAKWDKPKTNLKSNRRIDRVSKNCEYSTDFESDWNKKNKALNAFLTLIDRLDCKYIVISYSNESIVPIDVLVEEVENRGKCDISEVDYKRNIMSQIGNAEKNNPESNQRNKEYLILLEK